MKYNLEIEIKNIEVDERYYSFDYLVKLNGKNKWKGSYDSDYDNEMTASQWRKELEKGEALHLVLEAIGGEEI